MDLAAYANVCLDLADSCAKVVVRRSSAVLHNAIEYHYCNHPQESVAEYQQAAKDSEEFSAERNHLIIVLFSDKVHSVSFTGSKY